MRKPLSPEFRCLSSSSSRRFQSLFRNPHLDLLNILHSGHECNWTPRSKILYGGLYEKFLLLLGCNTKSTGICSTLYSEKNQCWF